MYQILRTNGLHQMGARIFPTEMEGGMDFFQFKAGGAVKFR